METLSSTLITRQQDDRMRIDHDALREVLIRPEIGDRPLAIISIAGKMRTGKSFLLNFIIRYLRATMRNDASWVGGGDTINDGFLWRRGKTRTTLGIEIWNEVFHIPQPNGRGEMAVIIMDTQGLFDQSTPEDVNILLLTLSTLISSVQIFNCISNLDTRNMAYLKTCVDFALMTAQVNEPFFKLQTINFLVRDVDEEDEENDVEKSFGYTAGSEYLQSILVSEKGGDENIRVRQGLKKSFSKVECFLLPHPGKNVKKRGFEGKNKELEEDFTEQMKVFVEGVASPNCLHPKTSRANNNMTAREILNMMAACDTLFARGMYKAENLVEANIRVYYATKCEESLLQYKEVMKQSVDIHKRVEEKEIVEQHQVAKKMAMQRYKQAKKMGDGKRKKDYEEYLKSKCEEHFEELKAKNKINMKTFEMKTAWNMEKAIRKWDDALEEWTSAGIVESKVFIEHHKRYIKDIRKKYGNKINEEKLTVETEKRLERILAINKENEKIKERNKKTKKEEELATRKHSLMLNLFQQCANAWSNFLLDYQTRQQMNDHAAQLEGYLLEQYRKHLLTDIEQKYIAMLMARLNEEFQRAMKTKKERGTEPIEKPHHARVNDPKPTTFDNEVERMRKLHVQQESKLSPNEIPYYRFVTKKIEEYAVVLQDNLNFDSSVDELLILHQKTRIKLESEYFREMCSHVVEFWEQLKDFIAHKYKEALGRNEQNLKYGERKIKNFITEIIWEEEDKLQEIMSDRCIRSDELTEYYKSVGKRFQEITSTAAGKKLLSILSVEHGIQDSFYSRLEKSKKKMQKVNGAAEEHVQIITTGIKGKGGPWWKKVSKFFMRQKNYQQFENEQPLPTD